MRQAGGLLEWTILLCRHLLARVRLHSLAALLLVITKGAAFSSSEGCERNHLLAGLSVSAGMRWPALLAALLACSVGAGATCDLQLRTNGSASAIAIGGFLVTPVQAQLTQVNRGVAEGLLGDLVLSLPGDCPADGAAAVAALPGATISTGNSSLAIFPQKIKLEAGSFSKLEWNDVRLNVSSSPLAAGAGGGGGGAAGARFSATASMAIPEGYVISQSIIVKQAETLPLVGSTASNTTTVVAAADGPRLRLELRDIFWMFESVYNGMLNGAPLHGVSNYTIRGTLAADVVLGCRQDCGPNGRCAAVGGGAPACSCACGWSGANCSVASGFCPRFPDEYGAAAVCPAAAPAPAPTPQSSDVLCKAPIGERASGRAERGCNTTSLYADPETGAQAARPITGNGPFCRVSFSLFGKPENPVSCTAIGCQFQEGLGTTQCASTSCKCQTACPDIQARAGAGKRGGAGCERAGVGRGRSALDQIEGQRASISCTAAQECTFDIDNFFVALTAPCTTADCLVSDYTLESSTWSYQPDKDYNPVIAAVPLMALVVLAAFLSSYLVRHRRFWTEVDVESGAAGDAPGGTGPGPGGSFGRSASAAVLFGHVHRPVQELLFAELQCSVPARSEWSAGGVAAALMRGTAWLRRRRARRAAEARAQAGARAAAPGPEATLAPAGSGESSGGLGGVGGVGGRRGRPMKRILRGVSGVARCGELVGVLGPSGSGKSTLLGVLAGSTEELDARSSLTGAVLLDGRRMRGADRRLVAFVPQARARAAGGRGARRVSDDTLLATLTVEECLRYSALLRLPGDATPRDVAMRVAGTMHELGLAHVADSQVGGGSGIRGISGGERRRVTIGMELVCGPSVVVLDEPTSGLDSFTALALMHTLKEIASGGRIVLLSFHQPSPAMFNLLDRAYLMAEGHCLYAGPPASAAPWFALQGLPCPPDVAIAEHMLHCACEPGAMRRLAASAGAAGTASATALEAAVRAETMARSIDLFMSERRLVVREVRGGYYRPASYLLAKAVLDALLLRVLPVFLYAAPFYPMVRGIPAWIRWLHYLSLFYYAFTSLMINELAGLTLNFSVEGYASVNGLQGSVFLATVGINPHDLTNWIIVLDCLWAGLMLLAFALLYWRMPRPRKVQERHRAPPRPPHAAAPALEAGGAAGAEPGAATAAAAGAGAAKDKAAGTALLADCAAQQ
eukprot:scaffold3.g6677.t1